MIGGLNPKNVFRLIDTYLVDHVKTMHGKEVNSPKILKGEKIDTVIVCSREYFFEINKIITKEHQVKNVVSLSQLLNKFG